MKIDFINSSYRRFFAAHKKEIMAALRKCYANGDFVLRDDIDKFEENLAKFVGTKYAIGVNSGTDALKVSYKALGLKTGDEVITVSHVFISPIEEIVHLGGVPVLIDVGKDGLMDVTLIEKAITEKTVGIVPIHLSGKVCNMDAIMKIAKKHKLWVVEDACQALGAYWKYKKAGSIGDTGCFSFIAPKTLGIGGDGGAIVTNNKKIYEHARLLRNHWNITQGALHGRQPKTPRVMNWGYNTRLDNIHAAVLNAKLKYYLHMLARRREIAMRYNKGFADLPIALPIQQKGQIYQEYIIEVPDMWEFKKYMDGKGIELLIRDTTSNHKMYEWYFGKMTLPITERIAKYAVRLPIYPELTDAEITYIIKMIRKFYGADSM